jgi:hypothetical protein
MAASGMTAGVITVAGDGTYTAVPTLGPFGVPGTATSLAQARFEQKFPVILAQMTSDVQAQVVDATTTPPTTNKGRVMQNLAAQINADVAADVGYIQANAVANVTTQSLGVMPSSTSPGTPIGAPSSPVKVPIE